MEQASQLVQQQLLKDFLAMVRKHKQEQLDQLTRELALIDEDQKYVTDMTIKCDVNKETSPPGEASAGSSTASVDSSSLELQNSDPSSSIASEPAFNRNTSQVVSSSLLQRRNKMTVHFDDLESCYFNTRARTLYCSSSSGDDLSSDALHEFSETLNKFTLYSSLR